MAFGRKARKKKPVKPPKKSARPGFFTMVTDPRTVLRVVTAVRVAGPLVALAGILFPDAGDRRREYQCGKYQHVGESIHQDERFEEAQDSFYAMVPADGHGEIQVGAGHELG